MAQELEHERRELRRSELRHRALVEHLPDAVVVLFDRDLRCIMAEGTMLRKQGVSSADLVGRELHETVPPEQYEQLAPSCRAELEGEVARIDYASPHNGVEYEMDVVPFIAEGDVQGVFTVSRDVTAARRAEQARRAAEERFREAFAHAHAPTGMAMATPSTSRCTSRSSATARVIPTTSSARSSTSPTASASRPGCAT